MTVTSTDVANEAIQLIGDNQPPVTGVNPTFDSSPAGVALSKLYGPCVAAVGRQFEWDFARNTVTLSLTGNTPDYWTYEYLYPTNGIEVWQIVPATITDANNPLPTTWQVANALVSSVQKKVIQTNVQNAKCVYNNNPDESVWDALFHQAVVRLLASALAMALDGRQDTAMAMLQSGAAFESLGEGRQD